MNFEISSVDKTPAKQGRIFRPTRTIKACCVAVAMVLFNKSRRFVDEPPQQWVVVQVLQGGVEADEQQD